MSEPQPDPRLEALDRAGLTLEDVEKLPAIFAATIKLLAGIQELAINLGVDVGSEAIREVDRVLEMAYRPEGEK